MCFKTKSLPVKLEVVQLGDGIDAMAADVVAVALVNSGWVPGNKIAGYIYMSIFNTLFVE